MTEEGGPKVNSDISESTCLVCGTNIDNTAVTECGRNNNQERDFVQIFLKCVSVSSVEKILSGEEEEVLKTVGFCRKCQLNLDEWEFGQEQIAKLTQRSRVLKATLLGKLLELFVETTKNNSGIWDGKKCMRDKIREVVVREYDPRVRLHKIKLEDYCSKKKSSKSKNHVKTSRHDFSKIPRTSSPPVKKIGKGDFLYKGKIPFSYRGKKYHCGLCGTTASQSINGFGWGYMLKHIRRSHKEAVEEANEAELKKLEECISVDVSENNAGDNNNNNSEAVHNSLFEGSLWSAFVEDDSSGQAEGAESMGPLNAAAAYDNNDLVKDTLTGQATPEAFDPLSALQVSFEDPDNDNEMDDAGSASDPAASRSSNDCENTVLGQMQETFGNISNENAQGSRPAVNQWTSLKEVGPGQYLYKYKVPVSFSNGRFYCGLCSRNFGGKLENSRHNVMKHVRRMHYNGKKSLTDMIRDRRIAPTAEPMEQDFRESSSTESSCSVKENRPNALINLLQSEPMEPPQDEAVIAAAATNCSQPSEGPSFSSSRVRQVSPGQYIYRGKIPFSYANNRFTCGLCFRIYDAHSVLSKHLLLHHMRTKHLEGGQGTVAAKSPKKITAAQGTSQVERFLYKDKVPYSVKDGAYYCGLCPTVVRSKTEGTAKGGLHSHIEGVHASVLEGLPDIRIKSSSALFASEDEPGPSGTPQHTTSAANQPSTDGTVVKEMLPGKYLYRGTIEFYYTGDGKYHCGMCSNSYVGGPSPGGRQGIIRHIRKRHMAPTSLIGSITERPGPAVGNAAVTAGQAGPPVSSATMGQPAPPPLSPQFYSEVTQIAPGRFLYQGKPFVRFNGKYMCGLCPTSWVESAGRGMVLLHLKMAHPGPAPHSAEQQGNVRASEAETGQFPQIQNSFSLQRPSSNPASSVSSEAPTPTFPSSKVRQTAPGQYIYRNKVPFSYVDGAFACGWCSQMYGGNMLIAKHQMLNHLRVKHAEGNTNRNQSSPTKQPPSAGPEAPNANFVSTTGTFVPPLPTTPTFGTPDVREVRVGEYVYRGQFPFSFRNNRFFCGLCNSAYGVQNSYQNILQHIKSRHERELAALDTSGRGAETIRSAGTFQPGNPPPLIPVPQNSSQTNVVPSPLHSVRSSPGVSTSPAAGLSPVPNATLAVRSSPVSSLSVMSPVRSSPGATASMPLGGSPNTVPNGSFPVRSSPTSVPVRNSSPSMPSASLPMGTPRQLYPGQLPRPTPVHPNGAVVGRMPPPGNSNQYAGSHHQTTSQPTFNHPRASMLPPEVYELGYGKYLYRNKVFALIDGKFRCTLCGQAWWAVQESWEMIIGHMNVAHYGQVSPQQPPPNRQVSPIRGLINMMHHSGARFPSMQPSNRPTLPVSVAPFRQGNAPGNFPHNGVPRGMTGFANQADSCPAIVSQLRRMTNSNYTNIQDSTNQIPTMRHSPNQSVINQMMPQQSTSQFAANQIPTMQQSPNQVMTSQISNMQQSNNQFGINQMPTKQQSSNQVVTNQTSTMQPSNNHFSQIPTQNHSLNEIGTNQISMQLSTDQFPHQPPALASPNSNQPLAQNSHPTPPLNDPITNLTNFSTFSQPTSHSPVTNSPLPLENQDESHGLPDELLSILLSEPSSSAVEQPVEDTANNEAQMDGSVKSEPT